MNMIFVNKFIITKNIKVNYHYVTQQFKKININVRYAYVKI